MLHTFKSLFVVVLACVSFGSASIYQDLTAPYEDTALFIGLGGGPSSNGIVVQGNSGMYQAIYAEGWNGGIGILGQDAVGVIAHGQASYPAISAEQHGSSWGVIATGAGGVAGFGNGDSPHYFDPVGVDGSSYSANFNTATGVRGTVIQTPYQEYSSTMYGVDGSTTGYNTNEEGYAVRGVSQNSYINYGVYGSAIDGVHNYGVYGVSSGGYYNNWAGWFSGDVNVTGSCYCYPSDEKLKKNVKPLERGLSTVMALKPKTYDMKVEEYKGKMNLAKGHQIGMIAQDVEQLLPELVTKISMPAREVKNKNGKTEKIDAMDYKTLNYVGMIPVLVKAIQELEAKVAALEKAKAK